MIEFFWIHASGPGRLAVMPCPRGGLRLGEELRSLRAAGIDIVVSMLPPEEEDYLEVREEGALARKHGMHFISHPIVDRSIPGEPELTWELARRLAEHFNEGMKIAVHCRMGIGRSPLLLACTMHVLGISAEEAWAAIGAARGYRVPDTEEQRLWLTETAPKS